MARIIAVANQKGGVGKTTTAVNLAACLAAAEKPTLLVDIDPQGNATSGVGLEKGALAPHIYHVLLGLARPEDVSRRTALSGLEVLPSGRELAGAEVELVGLPGREGRLRQALRPLAENFAFVLVDCPPSLGLLTVNALVAAEGVLIPLQCEYYALEGLTHLLEAIRLCRRRLNPSLEIFGVVLTMYDSRLNLADQVERDVRRNFPGRVFRTTIPRNVRLSEAPSFGRPIILYDIRSAGAEAYLRLAKEILDGAAEGAG